MLTKIKVADIIVGKRHRQDLGDIEALAASIKQLGLLQPIVIRSSDNHLVAGERRLEAVKFLGWTEVPVHVVDNLDGALRRITAERDENTCRKDFTPSEAVALGKHLEELEAKRAQQRRDEKLRKGEKSPQIPRSGNFPQREQGRTRDRVAEAVGMSGKTYEKAKKVVKAAEEDPEQYGHLQEEMDRTGKVDPAYQKTKQDSTKGKTARSSSGRKSDGKPQDWLQLLKACWGRASAKEKAAFRTWIQENR